MLKLAKNLTLPIDIAGQAICLFGIRGSGKTNTAGALAEELLNQHHAIAVIDPTDAWWGLRAGRDGSQSGGYQVFIFGGSHADIPLQETDGKVIAEFLVREQVPVILSLRHLRKAAQRRFVTEFCEELYHLKGKTENRTPLTVFIDEAPLFVPQKVMGEVARTVGAVEDLVARGRNAGFGVVLISQRPATLNADVRSLADTILCHRVTSPLDRKAISDWFEQNATAEDLKGILKSLATLKNGEAWIWAPPLGIMQQVQVRLRRTFDSSATPKAGEIIRPPKKLTEIDVEKLKGQLAETIEKAKAEDPRELFKQVKELKAQIAKLESAKPVAVDTEAIKVACERARTRARQEVERAFKPLVVAAEKASAALMSAIPAAIEYTPVDDLLKEVQRPVIAPRPIAPRVPRQAVESNWHKPEAGLRRMLIALAQRNGLSAKQIGLRACISSKSGTFGTYLGKARTQGWMVGEKDRLEITEQGLEAIGDFGPLPTGSALLEFWANELEAGAARMLRALADAYPKTLTAVELGEAAAINSGSGTFGTYLGRLRTLELVSGTKAELLASEELFS